MDSDDQLNLYYSMNRLQKSFSQCKICSAPAIHSNYGVISCSPCKMFFKRNAEIELDKFKCDFDGQCEINLNNRHMCTCCRLEKCFASGMKVELIRGSRLKKNGQRKNKKLITKDQFPTWNLLQTNQSILTIDQWNLFSTLMLIYDEHTVLLLAERFLSEQNILPLKLRFKCGPVQEFLASIFTKAQLLFEKNPHFRSLYSHDRSILLHRQMKYLILLSLSFIAQQSHLVDNLAFNKAIENLFGKVILITNQLFSFDSLFMKLSFSMICFSSFDYTIYESISTHNLTNVKSILQIQDLYIELAWRYFIYVYDEKKAINCFLNLIRCIVNLMNDMIVLRETKTFMDMMNSVIEQAEQSFAANYE